LDYIKACDQQFTLATKKSLHITFKQLSLAWRIISLSLVLNAKTQYWQIYTQASRAARPGTATTKPTGGRTDRLTFYPVVT